MVDKDGGDSGLTHSDVRFVDDEQRVAELARMLAGLESTETGRAHAEELLSTAAAHKAAGRDGRSGKAGKSSKPDRSGSAKKSAKKEREANG